VRGAPVLDDILREFPDAPIRAVVVWEPVLATDVAPPFSSVLGLVRDRRVAQFWDSQRTLSRDIVRAIGTDPQRYGFDAALDEDYIVWDVVAVFGTDARWAEDLPVPAYYDGPVHAVGEALREAIGRELATQQDTAMP
jgi:hypothetical protein